MTELSDCCLAEIHARDSQYKAYYICGRCGKPCKVVTPQEKADRVDSERLLNLKELCQIICGQGSHVWCKMKSCMAQNSFVIAIKAQRDLTASLKDKEIAELKKAYDKAICIERDRVFDLEIKLRDIQAAHRQEVERIFRELTEMCLHQNGDPIHKCECAKCMREMQAKYLKASVGGGK